MCVCAHVSAHDNEQVHVNSRWRRKPACRGTFCVYVYVNSCEQDVQTCLHIWIHIYIYIIKRLSWTLSFFALQDQFIQLKAVTSRKH